VNVEEALHEGARGFAREFGGEPEGIFLAPGRVNIIGEHTDYQLGLCLPLAIDRHIGVAARRRADRRVVAHSARLGSRWTADVDALAPAASGAWSNYVAGVLAALQPPRGIELYIFGDLASGAGLSSSAALEVSVGLALNDLYALGRRPQELALAGQRAERLFAGVSTGIMDQFASALGQEGKALLLDTRVPSVLPVSWNPEVAGVSLTVVDTRTPHRVTGGGYQERFEQARAAAAALGLACLRDATPADLRRLPDGLLRRRARHIVSENGRVLQVVEAAGRGEWAAVGRQLYASHRSLAVDYEVSHPALDLVVEIAAQTEGVFGARLTGAGFGGSALVLHETLAADDFGAALAAAYDARGWTRFQSWAVRAGPGATRIDGNAEAGEGVDL